MVLISPLPASITTGPITASTNSPTTPPRMTGQQPINANAEGEQHGVTVTAGSEQHVTAATSGQDKGNALLSLLLYNIFISVVFKF